MEKEFIDNLMAEIKTIQTKLQEEVYREKINKEEFKVNNWRTKIGNNAKLIGDINENVIIAHLMKSGYDVFKNQSCTGPIDMIAYHRENNEIIPLDAKSSESSANTELSKVLHKGIYTCWFNEDKKKVVIVKGEGECIEI
jgi:predicted AAA+ superfamily ATPase|tara:strand:+ start:52 stop:471 length:420 start_codon:yes stop_codon:yes gene_type:complete